MKKVEFKTKMIDPRENMNEFDKDFWEAVEKSEKEREAIRKERIAKRMGKWER